MAVRLSALRPGCPLPPRKIPGTHFYYRLSQRQGHSAAAKTRSIEKSSDLIGNWSLNLLACSVAPQPTTLPHAPEWVPNYDNLFISQNLLHIVTTQLLMLYTDFVQVTDSIGCMFHPLLVGPWITWTDILRTAVSHVLNNVMRWSGNNIVCRSSDACLMLHIL
jgi:hypothetical protein